jgi:serine/threonine protein kinase
MAGSAAALDAVVCRADTPLMVGTDTVRSSARFHLQKKLGAGSFGVVYRAIDTMAKCSGSERDSGASAGPLVAIKALQDVYGGRHDTLCALRELSIMRQCHHPNVIGNSSHSRHPAYYPVLRPRHSTGLSPRHDLSLWFVMDYCDLGDLASVMQARIAAAQSQRRRSDSGGGGGGDSKTGEGVGAAAVAPDCCVWGSSHVASILCQLLHGLAYLHARNIVHRDLKPANVLLSSSAAATGKAGSRGPAAPPAGIHLRICDFGLSRQIKPLSSRSKPELSPPPVAAASGGVSEGEAAPPPFGRGGLLPLPSLGRTLTQHVATRYYRAPEMLLLASAYDGAVDVWVRMQRSCC